MDQNTELNNGVKETLHKNIRNSRISKLSDAHLLLSDNHDTQDTKLAPTTCKMLVKYVSGW